MSAPLVVNTRDGQCWTRRAVTSAGVSLYALADVCSCPEFVMATLEELAALGIVGSAAAPMPVGAPNPVQLREEQIEALVAAGDRVVNDAVHDDLCHCDAWPEKCVSTSQYFMGAWDVSGLADALPAVLALWEQMRGSELVRLRARVAELEESPLAWTARLDAKSLDNFLITLGSATEHEPMSGAIDAIHELIRGFRAGASADRLTALLAPTQALRDDATGGTS